MKLLQTVSAVLVVLGLAAALASPMFYRDQALVLTLAGLAFALLAQLAYSWLRVRQYYRANPRPGELLDVSEEERLHRLREDSGKLRAVAELRRLRPDMPLAVASKVITKL
ncbi:hypothetical protein D5S17_00935 [Pseudonocardiaceae bacterium YIM PH 21723]|nr:hypothetical protein D5S17_00935 [Pseudonocardiaceae bacterium YIM PH 21723]